MKNKGIKGSTFSKTGLLLLLFLFIFTFQPVYANDHLQVIGSDIGLQVVMEDQGLFQELNLSPGDYKESKVIIKNNDALAFELFVKAERLEEEPSWEELDLYKKIQMKVNLRGEEIFNGSMANFAEGKAISLGEFQPGEVQEMDIAIHLPGEETGNEYMKISHGHHWIFSAQRKKDIGDDDSPSGPNLPKTGGSSPLYFYMVGAAMTIGGIVLKKKGEIK